VGKDYWRLKYGSSWQSATRYHCKISTELLLVREHKQRSACELNKVSGILFENKIDHTTYFGANPEYIEGIHMLPLLPSSTLTRTTEFVQEEWDTYFSNGRAEAVQGGWKGVLFANLALINPTASWNFFTASNWDASWLDGGASRTWYLALAAGMFYPFSWLLPLS
jgi:endo-1,3(4)-beta-glucanase